MTSTPLNKLDIVDKIVATLTTEFRMPWIPMVTYNPPIAQLITNIIAPIIVNHVILRFPMPLLFLAKKTKYKIII